MTVEIEKAEGIGFCHGVKRAVTAIEKLARQSGSVETLGATVHNQQVLNRLAEMGVRIARNIDDIRGNKVVLGAHGVSPETKEKLASLNIEMIDTTCGFVRRAQEVARNLAEDGFFVVIYGDANHPEVKGILGQTTNKGFATLDARDIKTLEPIPKRIGVLSQTTQIPSLFTKFIKNLVDLALTKDSELRIIDTICHDIRQRQISAMELAEKVDLMLVIGDPTSANSNRLYELCSTITKTLFIETADEIQPSTIKGFKRIGITGGASTAEETINEVIDKLSSISRGL